MVAVCHSEAGWRLFLRKAWRLGLLPKNSKALWLLLAALIFSLGLLEWGKTRETKERPAPPGKFSETIVVAADKDYSPYSFISGDGDFLGFDVEAIYALGEKMGKNVKLQLLTWSEAQQGLAEGRIDALMGMTYSEKRLARIDFSTPLTHDAYVAFGASGKELNIEDFLDKRLCTIENDAINEAFIIPYNLSQRTTFFPTYSECFKSVAAGKNDYAIAPYLTGKKLIAGFKFEQMAASGPVLNNSIYCIGVNKGNEQLLGELNKAILELSASGELKSLKDKWLVDYAGKTSWRMFLKENILYIIIVVLLVSFASYYFNERINRRRREKIFYIDPVTGFSNFNKFSAECEKILQKNRKPLSSTIVTFNIRSFKAFNDTFGYDAGDELLCATARLAVAGFSPLSFARVSADNFAMLLDDADSESLIKKTMALGERLNSELGSARIFLYFGIYVIDDVTLGINALYDRAQVARRSIENSNERHLAFYDQAIHDQLLHQKDVEARMDAALAGREFVIYLQPKYHLRKETFNGSEALVRWKGEDGKVLSPAAFIDIFEKNGFVKKLDMYVFEAVCRSIQENAGNHFFERALPVSVNISRKHLSSTEFIDRLVEISDKYGVSRHQLELEVTETAFVDLINDNFLVNILAKAREKGFAIAMDDFGSGYTSLAMMAEYPLDTIKIDRIFLLSPKKQKIIAKVIDIAKYLNTHVVCEGVETPEQVELLRRYGCDMVQGFCYARPMPIETFSQWMQAKLQEKGEEA